MLGGPKRETGNKKCSGVRAACGRLSCFTYFFPEARGIFTRFTWKERKNGMGAERKKRGRKERRRCGGAGSRLSAENRTGNRYPEHEAPPSLYVERVTPPLLARRVRSKHPRAVSGTVPSATSFSTTSATSTDVNTPPTTTFGPIRWMYYRHDPPITKSMAGRRMSRGKNSSTLSPISGYINRVTIGSLGIQKEQLWKGHSTCCRREINLNLFL